MSSQGHHKMSGKSCEDIDLTERFSQQMAQLCLSDDYSDVVFIVEHAKLPGHRIILAARSEYFRALLYGGMAESKQTEIHVKAPLKAFRALLKYIYSGHMAISQMDEDNVLDILGLAHQYGFTELETAISDYLRKRLSLHNICGILDAARLYNLEALTPECLRFMDQKAEDVLKSPTFNNLTKESLQLVLQRDSFFAPEFAIFMAVWEWWKNNPSVDIATVVSYVRLPLISIEHLLNAVRRSGILKPEKLLDAIDEQITSRSLPYRAALWPEENVATGKFMSRTIHGESRSSLLNGDYTSFDADKGFTFHTISDLMDVAKPVGIVVQLGTICILNHLKFLLWDHDNRTYSYYVEVSLNQVIWDRVIDYTQYNCRSWQYLYFPTQPVRYIRLVGTHNTVNKAFHVVHLEAMYTAQVPRLRNDIVMPLANVATIDMSATVIDGVSRTRNALINGDFVNYDWDSGYTCHQLSSGEIQVRLGQPYYIGSMRLLLWDCDDRTYSFYVETSVDQKSWQIVVDKRDEHARSWQHCVFTPRIIMYIRIVGTRNTANEIFHCVHLECPSQEPAFLQSEREKHRLANNSSETWVTSSSSLSPSGNKNQVTEDGELDSGAVGGIDRDTAEANQTEETDCECLDIIEDRLINIDGSDR